LRAIVNFACCCCQSTLPPHLQSECTDSVAALAKQYLPQIAPVPDMATHTADERFTPVKRGVATIDIWVMAAFAAVTIWVLFFV